MPPSDEAALSLELKLGKPEAWSRIYSANSERLHRYLSSRLGTNADADDLVAEVFERALAKIDSYTDRGQPMVAWLFGIAKNLVHEKRRETQKNNEVLDSPTTAEDHAESVISRVDLTASLEKLSHKQAEVILLRYTFDLSPAEVASLMNQSERSIRYLESRALVRLRNRMTLHPPSVGAAIAVAAVVLALALPQVRDVSAFQEMTRLFWSLPIIERFAPTPASRIDEPVDLPAAEPRHSIVDDHWQRAATQVTSAAEEVTSDPPAAGNTADPLLAMLPSAPQDYFLEDGQTAAFSPELISGPVQTGPVISDAPVLVASTDTGISVPDSDPNAGNSGPPAGNAPGAAPPGNGPDGNGPPGLNDDPPPGNGPDGNGPPGLSDDPPPGNGPDGNGPPGLSDDAPPGNGPAGNGPPGLGDDAPPGKGPNK